MIIEPIQQMADRILQYNQYMDEGFVDVDILELGLRKGVFKSDNQGNFEFAMPFQKNFFYIRRNGNTTVGGSSQTSYELTTRFKLFACAKDVDLYRFINCIFSTIGPYCSDYNITNIDTETEKIMLGETKNKDIARVILSKFTTEKIFTIDFNSFELYNTIDMQKCDCNPCLNCAE